MPPNSLCCENVVMPRYSFFFFFKRRALLFFEKQRQHNSKVLKKMHYFKSKQEGKENAYPSVELAKTYCQERKYGCWYLGVLDLLT